MDNFSSNGRGVALQAKKYDYLMRHCCNTLISGRKGKPNPPLLRQKCFQS